MKGVKRFDGVRAARFLGQEEGWERKNSGQERQQGEATPVGAQCPWRGEHRVKEGRGRRRSGDHRRKARCHAPRSSVRARTASGHAWGSVLTW